MVHGRYASGAVLCPRRCRALRWLAWTRRQAQEKATRGDRPCPKVL
jgi:hypothetical protein